LAIIGGAGVTTLGIDTGNTDAELDNFANGVGTAADVLHALAGATTQCNAEGDILSHTFKQILEDGSVLTTTLKRVRDAAKNLTNDFLVSGQSITRAKKDLADFNAAAKAQIIDFNKNTLFQNIKSGFNTSDATPGEINTLNNAIVNVTTNLEKEGVTLERIGDIFTRLKAGADNFAVSEQGIVNQLQAVVAAGERLGSAQGKINELTKAKASKNLNTVETSAARDSANSIYSSALTTANPTQLLAYKKALEQSLVLVQRGAITAKQFTEALNNIRAGKISTDLTPALAVLQQRLVAVQGAFTTFSSAGQRAFANVGISASGVIRIIESQVIYAALGAIQSAFGQSTQSAAEYSKQVGLIQTISQDANVTTGEWTEGIRALSDKLGLPIADTAAATYEALSNQVAKGADAFKFLATAGEFARTTNSSLADSVTVISASLNSFNLSASEADRVAKSLFTTIDLGRVKANELLNRGRIDTQADTLKVSLEETNALISVLTRQGIKANEAFTLIGNVFQKLEKPTEELQRAIESLGFSTADSAIIALGGVTPLLIKLKELSKVGKFNGNDFFPEIRGRRGFENITKNGGAQVNADIAAQLQDTGQYDKAKAIVAKTFGQQFTEELNKLKNFFTVDVGGTFLRNVVELSNSIGGLADKIIAVINVLKVLATVATFTYFTVRAIAAVQAFREFGVAIGFITTAFRAAATAGELLVAVELAQGAALSFATAGVSAIVGLAATYLLLYNDVYDSATNSFREITAKYQEESDKVVAIEQKAADERSKAFEKGLNNAKSALLKYSGTVRQALQKTSDSLEAASVGITDRVKAQFDVVTSTARSQLQELESRIKSFEAKKKSNKEKLSELPDNYNDAVTQRNLAVNDLNVSHGGRDQGLQILFDQVNRLKTEASKVQFDINNPDRLEKILSKIDSVTQDITQRAIQSENTSNIAAADGLRIHNLQQQESLILRQNKALERQAEITRGQLSSQKSLFEQFEEAQKHVLSFTPFDKQGELKDKYRGPGGANKAESDFKQLQDKATGFLSKLNAGLDTRIHTSKESAQQFADLQKALADQKGNLSDRVKNREEIFNHDANVRNFTEELDNASRAIGEFKDKILGLSREQQDNLRDVRALAAAIPEASKSVGVRGYAESAYKTFSERATAFSSKADNKDVLKDPKNVDALLAEVAQLKKDLALTDANNNKGLLGGIPGPKSFSNATIAKGNGLDADTTIGTALDKIEEKLRRVSKDADLSRAFTSGQAAAEKVLSDLETKVSMVDSAFQKMPQAASIGSEGIASEMSIARDEVQSLLAAVESVKNAIQQIGPIPSAPKIQPSSEFVGPPAPTVEEHAKGGRVGYYATGGFVQDFLSGKYAKGSDVIPSMLSKGEYVVDANSTRKFLPLLRSITDGSFRPSPKGTSNSTNVGDIHINVQGGNTSQQTIREIGSGLRRGIRQGTIRLN